MKLWHDSEWLKGKFSISGITIAEVAALANCNERTIRRALKKFGLKAHSISEQASYRQTNTTSIDDISLNIIEGELLGDGSLFSRSRYSAKYQHSTSRVDYLYWLQSQLGFQTNIRMYHSTTGFNEKRYIAWHLSSNSYAALKPLYDNWYQENGKKVPENFNLTSRKGLHWYLGDGCLVRDNNPILCTHGFDFESNYLLIEELRRNSIKAVLRKQQNWIYISTNRDFLEYIGECPTQLKDVYGYKWRSNDKT